jgi:hypothetical protein
MLGRKNVKNTDKREQEPASSSQKDKWRLRTAETRDKKLETRKREANLRLLPFLGFNTI